MQAHTSIEISIQRNRALNILLLAACLSLFSCAPRFAVYQAQSQQVALDESGEMTYSDTAFTIVYEFWSPGGAPWVSIYNGSQQEAMLDLLNTNLTYVNVTTNLADRVGVSLDGRSIRERFERSEIVYRDGSPFAVLPKGEWTAFEIPAIAFGRCSRESRNTAQVMHCADFEWNIRYTDSNETYKTNHSFTGSEVVRLKAKDLDNYATEQATNNLYFDDTRPNQSQVATDISLSVIDVLFLFISI